MEIIDVKNNTEIKYSVDGLNYGEQKKECIGLKGSPSLESSVNLKRVNTNIGKLKTNQVSWKL